MLAACAKAPVLDAEPRPDVDFSGHWELDYARSDQLRENIDSLRRLTEREARNRAPGPLVGPHGFPGQGLRGGTAPVMTPAAIIGLGHLTELIARTTVLVIEHVPDRIRITRQASFPLLCWFQGGRAQEQDDEWGTEYCGWRGDELVFAVRLPEGLEVEHRLSRSGSPDRLRLVTTVQTNAIPRPFTLTRVYQPFEPVAGD